MALPEEDQPAVIAWADQQRQIVQHTTEDADADAVFAQISRGLKK